MPHALFPRRSFIALAAGGMIAGARPVRARSSAAADEIAALEGRIGGRLGVSATDTGTGRTLSYRADERFAMCSTHKLLVAAAILSLAERGGVRLDQRVRYGTEDILDYAPVTKRNLARGGMTVAALCEAAVRWSDNTADNLLLRLIGGPAGWTRYARGIGDRVSRLDRFEPDLNSAIPGDPRDTSTPAAMTRSMISVLLGNALTPASCTRLRSWMLDSEITRTLLRAGLPGGWHVADKSGSGSNGSRNDIGLLYPPDGAPIAISVLCTGSNASMAARETVITRCAAIAVRAFRGDG